MLAADADAPTGNHHVFAMKKYVLTKVISQMMISRTRPMDHDLPTWILGLPHRGLLEITEIENWESKPGRIYHSFFRAQAGSCISFFPCTKAIHLDVKKIFSPKIEITH